MRTRNTIDFKDFVMDQIRHRYAPVGKISDDNKFIYNIFDNEIYYEDLVLLNDNLKLLKGEDEAYSNYYPTFIKTKTAWKILKKGLPESLKDIKKVRSPKIKKLAKTIQSKKIKLAVVGYGGAMSNILYNLGLVSDQHRTPLFEKLLIIEPEKWSLTNIFRIAKPLMHKGFSRFENVDGDNTVYKIQTFDVEEKLVDEEIELRAEYLNKEEALKLKEEGYIFIGAPDFKTREMLQEIGATFIMTGHANNNIRITKNPILNGGAIVETYGTIDIGVLISNFWLATFALLDIFANQDVQSLPDDTELYKFNFDEYFSAEECKKLKESFKEELN